MVLVLPPLVDSPKVPVMCRQDTFFQYLPVTEETMSWGMYVTGTGRVTIHPGERYPPTGHPALYQFDWVRGRTLPEFQLVFMTDGAGEFESEATGHVRFTGPTLIFLFPGVWHRYRPDPQVGWSERWISFNGEMLHRLFDTALFGPRLAVATPRDPQRLAEQYDKMLAAIHDHAVQHPLVLTFQAMSIISDAVAHRLEDAVSAGAVPRDDSTYSRLDDPIVQKALEL